MASRIPCVIAVVVARHLKREGRMTKVVNCEELGFDCGGVVRAKTEEEALEKVARHANEAHEMDQLAPESVENVRDVMREE